MPQVGDGFSASENGSSGGKVVGNANRPVDVPCPRCGVFNYLDAGRTEGRCFKCGDICRRFGNPNAKEIAKAETAYDRALECNKRERWVVGG